jgi:hypothetical protein
VGLEAPHELTDVHSRLLKIALAAEESSAYWANVDPAVPSNERARIAFEARWFGPKSEARVRDLLSNFALRYDAFPKALGVLRGWRAMSGPTRALVCHWHLQLADPVYRAFTGELLAERRAAGATSFDRSVVSRWLRAEHHARWAESTCVQIASKLLSAASEAKLCTPKKDPRTPLIVSVPNEALAYLLYLLRETSFDGTLTDNLYLRSVGLTPRSLGERLRHHPDVSLSQISDVFEFDWAYPSFERWAEVRT